MTPEIAESALARETPPSESIQQADLRSWFIGPASTQTSSEANFRETERQMHSPPADLSLPATSAPNSCEISHIVGAYRSFSVHQL